MPKNRRSGSVRDLGLIEALESRTLLSAGPQVVGYLPDYEVKYFNNIDLGALTWINYFSIDANSTGTLSTSSSSGYSLSQLTTVVNAAHSAPSRVGVSIVIDPSSAFQAIAGSTTATNTFITNILTFCSTYNLDGIDLDYEPPTNSLSQAQINTWGSFLGTLHAQTAAHGLILSEAVQVSQPYIIPQADLSFIDRYNVMVYALDYNSSAPYSESITYLNNWVTYGVPKADLIFGMPFYGSSGTGWGNSTPATYSQIINGYEAAVHAVPSPSADTLTFGGTTWGFNGVTTVENKTQYALQYGFGGVMIWELGQDIFPYNSLSLLPAIKSVIAAAYETWTGAVSSSWSTPGNWNFGSVPTSATNVVINGGSVTAASPITVSSLVLNGGRLTLPSGTSTTNVLSINNGASIDLGTGVLMIDYGSGADPSAAIRGYLISGLAGGTWGGPGIMSSAAESNSTSYGIGYADSADPNNPAGLATGTIKIMYTLLGDANLDGAVNGTDFVLMSDSFNQSVSAWDEGDFNYDGAVNGTDFLEMSSNFNQSIGTLGAVQSNTVSVPASTSTAATDSGSTTAVQTGSSVNQQIISITSKHARKRR